MGRKNFIIILVIVIAVISVAAGIFLHDRQQNKINNNGNDSFYQPLVTESGDVTPELTPEAVITQNVTPNEPTIKDLQADSLGLYPVFSGKPEKIWDDYESIPIDIVALGKEKEKASYKVIWSKTHLYIQVTVYDSTPDVSGKKYDVQDSVEVFLNEDGKKHETLVVGDSHYIVNRENKQSTGFGAADKFESVTYEIVENDKSIGYVVEMAIPFQTTRPNKNDEMGFDIQINNAVKGGLVSIRKWASNYIYTYQNFKAVGTLIYK